MVEVDDYDNVILLTVFVSMIFYVYSFSAVVQVGFYCLLGRILYVYWLSVLPRA
jgi:hypothetical protein